MKHKRFVLPASLASVFLFTLAALVAETKSPTRRPLALTNLSATCFCKISKDRLDGVKSATGVIKDLTGEVNKTFTFQGQWQQELCAGDCSNTANKYVNSQSVAAAACAANVSDNTSIYVYSAVGTSAYREVRPIGRLRNSPPVTQTTCTCPTGWTCNGCSPQVDGGITNDGKCKKVAAWGNSIPPYPPNGTPIGSWGFTWDNYFVAWGTSANGGAPACVTTVTSAGLCGWY